MTDDTDVGADATAAGPRAIEFVREPVGPGSGYDHHSAAGSARMRDTVASSRDHDRGRLRGVIRESYCAAWIRDLAAPGTPPAQSWLLEHVQSETRKHPRQDVLEVRP
jgi:hypothetical protein